MRIHTSFDPAMSCGIGNVQVEGIDTQKLGKHVFDTRRIIVVPIKHDEFDLFAEAMEQVIAKGLPA